MAAQLSPQPRHHPARPDLSNAALAGTLVACAGLAVIYFAARPYLPGAFDRPGSPVLHLAAVAGSALLLVPAGFAFVKRSGRTRSPNRWLAAHMLASCAGFVLVAAHTAGRFGQAPFLLVLALLGLVVSGAVARIHVARSMAATLGTKRAAYRRPDPVLQARLRKLIARKQALLARLEPKAREATFSVTMGHLLRSPCLAFTYLRLAREEARLTGARRSVPVLQAYWRPVHLALAWAFVAGLMTHIITVTFFAGYVAGGREIYWWHLAAW